MRGSFYLYGISRNDNYRLFQQDLVAKHTSALAQANHVEQPQGTPLNSKRPINLAAGHRQVSNDLQQPTNSRHFQDQVLSTWREDQLTSMFDNRNSCEHLSQEFVGELSHSFCLRKHVLLIVFSVCVCKYGTEVFPVGFKAQVRSEPNPDRKNEAP